MATNFLFSLSSIVLIILLFLPSSMAISTQQICNQTEYPSYCQNIFNSSSSAEDNDIYYYGRLAVQTSLVRSQRFVNSVQNYLQYSHNIDNNNNNSGDGPTQTLALKGCKDFASSNVYMLDNIIAMINNTNQVLSFSQANTLQDKLTALLPNLYTCLDLLETTPTSENIRNDLSQMIDDDVKVHMISLTLCTEGWVSKDKKNINNNNNNNGQQSPLLSKFKLASDKANKKAILESILKGVKVNVDHHHHSEDENQQGFVIINDFVVVSKDGSWDFTSINDAINAAPSRSYNDGYFLIYVTAGVYSEYVNVGAEKTNLFLLGEGIHKTVITGNRNNADGFSISSSATLSVSGDGFMGANLSVVNAAGLHKEQAVALRNTADHSTFYSCSFEGYQDTLYIHSHRQFYRDCDIYGTVDFIFGNATAIIQNSNIYVRKPLLGQSAVITAHGRTHPTQQSGISIHNSNILPTTDLTTSNARLERRRRTKAFLGRPWRDCARVVYMQSYMDGVIDSAGWHRWDQTDFGLNDAYMGEYNNWGPGSHTEKRPKWSAFHILNTTDAQDFTVSNFIDGDSWLPQTGVPYTGGLI
ncbi:hypothetical protein CsatB_021517 [Cannabis sativa]